MSSTATTPARSTGDRQLEQIGVDAGDPQRLASLFGGSALALYGLSRRSPGGIALALLGGALVYRGITGRGPVYQALGIGTSGRAAIGGTPLNRPIHVERSVTIDRSPADLYRFWHNFENLPAFMKHLESVKTNPGGRTHWVAKAPLGATAEWDAEIVEDRENELIAWRSVPDAEIANAGSVRFKEAPGGRGTVVHVSLDYTPPGGVAGATFAKLFGEEPTQQVGEDLYRFKSMMEAGEIPTVDGQPSGREKQRGGESTDEDQPQGGPRRTKNLVQEASEESFPASDAPSFTTSTPKG